MIMYSCGMFCFFFFSSRRRHTRLQGDWSSDVCSSDLLGPLGARCAKGALVKRLVVLGLVAALLAPAAASAHPLGNFTINRFSRVEVREIGRASCRERV